MPLFGGGVSGAHAAFRDWPHWLRSQGSLAQFEHADEMRTTLSATMSYAHCSNEDCRARRNCRYDMGTNQFFCSEECWEAVKYPHSRGFGLGTRLGAE